MNTGFSENCMKPDAPGRELVKRLLPDESDYLVLKTKAFRLLCNTIRYASVLSGSEDNYPGWSDHECMRTYDSRRSLYP